MPKSHFKSNTLFSKDKSLNVDRENGVINNVCIAQHGENKNYSYFNDQFLSDLVKQGNEQTQGVKCRFGHPNMCSTSLGDFLGRYKNFYLKDRKVYANLHLDESAKESPTNGDIYNYVLNMAEINSDMFGNSIVVMCDFMEEKDDKGNIIHDYSLILKSFLASDLVDDPAATDELFNNSDDLGIVVTQFLDENPLIFEAISKKPEIFFDFIEKYENYLIKYKSKTNMNFFKKLKEKYGNKEKFDIEETTADGKIIKVVTEDENPKVGDSVTWEDGSSVEDGDVTIKDGTVWVVEGGKISEIKPKEEETSDDDVEPTNTEVMQSVNALAETFKTFQSQYKEDLKDNQDAIELVADTFEKKFNNLAKTVKSSSPDYQKNADDGKKKKFNQSGYDAEKVKEERNKRKNK